MRKFPRSLAVRINRIDGVLGCINSGKYLLRCRLYRTAEGLSGLSEPAWIERALASGLGR